MVTVRGRWWPLRTTRRPRSSVSAANSAMYWLTSASRAAASMRRAPSRTISSIREPDWVEPSSVTTLSTGRTFPTRAETRAYSVTITGSVGKVALRVPSRSQSTGLEHCSIEMDLSDKHGSTDHRIGFPESSCEPVRASKALPG